MSIHARICVLACTNLVAHILSFTQLAPSRSYTTDRKLAQRTQRLFRDEPTLFCENRVTGGMHLLETCHRLYAMQEAVFRCNPHWPLRYPHGFFYRYRPLEDSDTVELRLWIWKNGFCRYEAKLWFRERNVKPGPLLDMDDPILLNWFLFDADDTDYGPLIWSTSDQTQRLTTDWRDRL